ncbi:glycine dehydrogenase, partial [Reticulomyxa filosa]
VHRKGGIMIAATDLLACTQVKPPGEWGADIVVGTSQRFGVPLGYGGPHAGFLATEEQYLRKMPGRIIGITRDSRGKPAYRMTLQTREQHIRRDKATSNICTAQALLANVSAAYAIYHGPKGLDAIGKRVHLYACALAQGLKDAGATVHNEHFFDTIQVSVKGKSTNDLVKAAEAKKINLRRCSDGKSISISFDETTTIQDVDELIEVYILIYNIIYTYTYTHICMYIFTIKKKKKNILIQFDFRNKGKKSNATQVLQNLSEKSVTSIPSSLKRESEYLTHSVFNNHHSETAMMRYLYSLERRDLGLNTAMIPLGSCTMKLNSATVMTPVTWPQVNSVHPFVPTSQVPGYQTMLQQMEQWLREITGFDGVSLQPNSGAQGEYTGLMAIRAYQQSKGETHRNICLIPTSAHGTNPASAAMVGWKVVPVKCDVKGNVDLKDLAELAKKHEKQF